MNKIKFGVIGFGHIGKRHASMIQLNEESELISICDTIVDQINDKAYPEVSIYSSAEEMLKNEFEIDVVCVCTPNGLHIDHATLALDFDKHVIVEKPLGLSKKNCEKLIEKAKKNNKNIFCVMQNRYSPPSIWLKDMVDSNKLGDIYNVQINCYWNRDDRYYFKDNAKNSWRGTNRLDGGTLFTQFSHFIDLMYWIFGDITDIQAKFDNFSHKHSIEFEDTGIVNFRFVNGGMGSINYSSSVWDSNLESSVTVIAENGSIKVGGQYMNEVEYCNVKDYRFEPLPDSNPANDYGSYKGSANNHPYVFENVVDVLNNKESISTNAHDGMKVVDIIERIYSLK